jgi:glycosyltransferase involved in cell wall biosynthesis
VTPRLTIITPSLNQAQFLERAIRSVLDQQYDNLEYMVVDGGSTDGSAAIIERYSDKLAWWVSESDRGQTHALNKGLARATGDYIAYINSDDYYLPGAFEIAVSALERTQAPWVAGACRYVDIDGRLIWTWIPGLPEGRRHRWVLRSWGVPQPSTFWTRKLVEKFGPFREDMHYAFDTEYCLRLAYGGVFPELVDAEFATRVIHPGAKSWNDRPFASERRRLVELYAKALTPRERAALLAIRTSWHARGLRQRAKRRILGRP